MCYYLDIHTQIQRIITKLEIFNKHAIQNNEDLIIDVYDGDLYKDLLNSDDGQYIINNEGFSFLINTDGISISTKSETSIWPIMLVIDQIKPGQRFCFENVIFAGKLSYNCSFFIYPFK